MPMWGRRAGREPTAPARQVFSMPGTEPFLVPGLQPQSRSESLRPIHQNDSDSQVKNVADIIFVDDLTSAGKRTWPAISQPSQIGDGRLFEYVYDPPVASMDDLVSKEGVERHAKRLLEEVAQLRKRETKDGTETVPVIFVAHGFGGLICENALVIAKNTQENIFRWMRGIILLNTPHYRAGIAEWATISARTIGVVKKVKPKVWKGLKDQFDGLVAIQDTFRELVEVRNKDSPGNSIQVACCFELLHDAAEDPMLSPEWAILPEFQAFRLWSDSYVTAPESSDDQKVNHLTDELLRWVKELSDTEHRFLLDAMKDGRKDEAAQLLARYVSIYRTLRAAVEEGHGEIVRTLVDKLLEQNEHGSALLKASQEGHANVVQVLLDHNTKFHRSRALLAAAERGNESVVQVLLDDSAHCRAQSENYVGKGGALQSASFRGNQEEVRKLLREDADVNACGGYFDTALQAASVRGHEMIVQQLLEKGACVESCGSFFNEFVEKEEEEVTPLYTASCQGYEAVVDLLVEKRANVNAEGGIYGNALQAASSGGYESVVQKLLDNGAKVNAQGGRFGTALQAASSKGHGSIVRRLIQNRANVNQGPCLLVASENGHETIVQLLLDNGADPNQYLCLLAASRCGHVKIVKMLLEKGARSRDALRVAAENGHQEVVQVLREYGDYGA